MGAKIYSYFISVDYYFKTKKWKYYISDTFYIYQMCFVLSLISDIVKQYSFLFKGFHLSESLNKKQDCQNYTMIIEMLDGTELSQGVGMINKNWKSPRTPWVCIIIYLFIQ